MYILGLTKIGLNIGGCVSHVIYLIVSDCCLGPEGFSQLNHLKFRASKPSHQFIHLCFGSHPDRVKYGGCVSLVIYLIVSSFCIGPEASSQHHHLKIRASKSWQQFIEWIFWSHPKRVRYSGVWSLVFYIIVGCCLGPEASSQLDHVKFRASKPSQQFIQCIFWVRPR